MRSVSLLAPTLKTTQLAIAQANMLHGDLTAQLVFDQLWDPTTKRFWDLEKDIKTMPMRLKAYSLVKANPFISKNVLMLALDASSKYNGTGQEINYGGAMALMRNTREAPSSWLDELFGNSVRFGNLWKPIDGSAKCGELSEELRQKQCFVVPHAFIGEHPVPLPSANDFVNRRFDYPPILYKLIDTRDKIASRIAHFSIFRDSAQPELNAEQLIESLAAVAH